MGYKGRDDTFTVKALLRQLSRAPVRVRVLPYLGKKTQGDLYYLAIIKEKR